MGPVQCCRRDKIGDRSTLPVVMVRMHLTEEALTQRNEFF